MTEIKNANTKTWQARDNWTPYILLCRSNTVSSWEAQNIFTP